MSTGAIIADGTDVPPVVRVWVMIAVHVQASRHLPAHIEQLTDLRDADPSLVVK